MENNENGFAPEMEVPQEQPAQQPVEQPVEQPAQQDAPKQDVSAMINSGLDKAKGVAQNLLTKAKALPKLVWIGAGAAITALIAVILVLALTSNTYKSPIKAVEKLLNSKSMSQAIDRAPAVLNGFGEKEVKQIIKIAQKSDLYKDNKGDLEDGLDELIDRAKDEFGNNYKIRIKVAEKNKIDKDDYKDFQDELRDLGEVAEKILDKIDDSDIYDDIADEVGLSKSQVKDAVKSLESFAKECKKAKVTAGYELDLVIKMTGSELDEPEEEELSLCVYKINGRWFLAPDAATMKQISSTANQLPRYLDYYDIEDLLDSLF